MMGVFCESVAVLIAFEILIYRGRENPSPTKVSLDLERVVGTSTPTELMGVFCLSVAVWVSIWLLSRIKITANTVGEHSVRPRSKFDL